MSAVIRARDLVIEYATDRGPIRALDGADLAVEAGESVGIVGESGSGKTTLGLAIGRLLAPNARVLSGDLAVLDEPVLQLGEDALRELRRTRLGFIFQNPMAALDPTMTIGRQLLLVLSRDGGGLMSPREHLLGPVAQDEALVDLLDLRALIPAALDDPRATRREGATRRRAVEYRRQSRDGLDRAAEALASGT